CPDLKLIHYTDEAEAVFRRPFLNLPVAAFPTFLSFSRLSVLQYSDNKKLISPQPKTLFCNARFAYKSLDRLHRIT
ncbi:hypothetical protein, partial [Neisseria sp. HMSC074B07]|uniref:hypothetical protein n=1 Tax=Neisseria sp. HMSC074B07 TaxID=1715205 RepID=UPI001AEF8D1C